MGSSRRERPSATTCRSGRAATPAAPTDFGIGGNGFAKYAYFAATLTNGRFSHTFGSELPDTAMPTPKAI